MAAGQFFDESERRLGVHKLRERIAVALVRCQPWCVTPEDRDELERFAKEVEALLQQDLPPGLDRSWLHRDLGEIEQRRAEICTWRGELVPAEPLFEKAARSFDAAGLQEKAQRCRGKLASLANWGSRDVDDMARGAQGALAAMQEGTLEHCEALLETAQAHLAANDLFAARRWLDQAKEDLERLVPQPPSREELLATVLAVPDGSDSPGTPSPFLRLSRIHHLYLGLYGGLTTVCQRMNQHREAEHYSQGLRELRANEPTPAELNELWRQTRPTMQRFDQGTLEILRPEGQQALLDELRQLGGDDFVREMSDHQRAWEEAFKVDPFAAVEISAVNPAHIREDLESLDREDEERPGGAPREDLLDCARALREKARACGSPPLTAWAQISEASLLSRSGRDDEADEVLDGAEETLGESGEDLKVFLYGLRAEIEARRGDWPAVSATCEQGIDLVEKLRFRVSTPYMQSAYLKPRLRLYTLGVRASHELGRVGEMLDRADRSKSRAILGYSRLSWAEAGDAPAIRQELEEVHRQADAEAARGQVSPELRWRRVQLWERLFLERILARRTAPLPDLDLEALCAELAPDEALLYFYWLGERELLLAVLDGSGVWHEVREITAAQRERLQAFSRPGPAEGRSRVGLPLPAENRPLREWLEILSGFLLPPVERLAGKRRLLVSPHRLLHTVPFQALPWQGDFLLRSFAIRYVPNLGSLLLPLSAGPRAGVLAVGVGTFEGAVTRKLRPLANAEKEATKVAEIYRQAGSPAVLLAGGDACKERLQALARAGDLSRFACLHIATHGENLEEDAPMESKLHLRDASVDAMEIADWQLNADLVVLGACWSGKRAVAGRGLGELAGDEMLGLQAAFFAAGARQVLGALWPAGDRVAHEVLTDFHCRLTAGAPPDEALRSATLGYLDAHGGGSRIYRWAPFYLVSLGRLPSG